MTKDEALALRKIYLEQSNAMMKQIKAMEDQRANMLGFVAWLERTYEIKQVEKKVIIPPFVDT